MATFRVGQRVRIRVSVWLGDSPSPDGQEGFVAGVGNFLGDSGRIFTHHVIFDSGREAVCDSDELEPIQPERNRVVAWEDLNLPFDPRKVGEVA
jgi:hypothetical protein